MRKLYRSRSDRWVAGVCGGIAKFFGIDSTIIRLIFLFTGGISGVYVLLWIFLPEDPVESKISAKGLSFGKIVLIIFVLLFVLPFIYFFLRNFLGF